MGAPASPEWENGPESIPSSSQSLPQIRCFQKRNKQHYWPKHSGFSKEALFPETRIDKLKRNPRLHLPHGNKIGQTQKSLVYAVGFERDLSDEDFRDFKTDLSDEDLRGGGGLTEDWLAVKLVGCNSRIPMKEALREVEMLREFRHPHLIAILGSYLTDNRGELSLGLILGPLTEATLPKVLRGLSDHNHRRQTGMGHWNVGSEVKSLLQYIPCLCRTILFLHAHKSKHRDIKPNNILVDREGNIILTDFDTAKKYRTASEAVTHGSTHFTKEYASHAAKNGVSQGFCKDINSLGFVLLDMVSIVFGETESHLHHHLIDETCHICSSNGEEPDRTGIPAGGSTTAPDSFGAVTSAESSRQTLEYSVALAKGRVQDWIDHLKNIPRTSPRQMPADSFQLDGQSKTIDGQLHTDVYLDKIYELMKVNDDGTEAQILCETTTYFSHFADSCKHCHPDLCEFSKLLPPYAPSTAPGYLSVHTHTVPRGGSVTPNTETTDLSQSDLSVVNTKILQNITEPHILPDEQWMGPDAEEIPQLDRRLSGEMDFKKLPGITFTRASTMDRSIADTDAQTPSRTSREAPTEEFSDFASAASEMGDSLPAAPPMINSASNAGLPRAWTFRRGAWKAETEKLSRLIAVYSPSEEMHVHKSREYVLKHASQGILIPLRRRLDPWVQLPNRRSLNLNTALGFRTRCYRGIGLIRWLFVFGDFTEEELRGVSQVQKRVL